MFKSVTKSLTTQSSCSSVFTFIHSRIEVLKTKESTDFIRRNKYRHVTSLAIVEPTCASSYCCLCVAVLCGLILLHAFVFLVFLSITFN